MKENINLILDQEKKKDINEMIAILMILPESDRTILMSNANILKTRQDYVKANG
ncbi:MAG: hypothetical protein KH020_07390 [Clostridiales bacterium]|nr:hypothetical protein [Clostridiales bacterium]